MDLKEKIVSHNAKVGVVGLGYVGLPLAVEFADTGIEVVGYDVDCNKLESLRKGRSYIGDIESSKVGPLVLTGQLRPTNNPEDIGICDVIVICVPTPCTETNDPDLTYVESAGGLVRNYLRPEHLVILESTSFPGTTEEVLQPILEQSGLRAGDDFHLAFSPERIDPGNAKYNLRNTPKLVAGTTPFATDLAEAFYACVADQVICVSSPKVAEMAKLYENTFRHINIAFANEMALLCEKMGIDIWEVIRSAASKPFGFMAFYPGPGVGGHCIPVDPQYLLYKARQYGCDLKFVQLANAINEHMPQHVAERVRQSLKGVGKGINGANLLVLGVAYKKDIDDVRESPAVRVIRALVEAGARVKYHDPYVPSFQNGCGRFESTPLTDEEIRASDCVLICTDHSTLPYDRIVQHSRLVVDTRNALNGKAKQKSAEPARA